MEHSKIGLGEKAHRLTRLGPQQQQNINFHVCKCKEDGDEDGTGRVGSV